MTSLHELLATGGTVLADGAMGTQLFAVGLTAGDPPEAWNVDHPAKIQAVHAAYIQAGSDLVLTNSFGGSSFRLKLHRLQDRAIELNAAAAQCARRAADESGRAVVVAGSMGPSGELMVPMGEMTADTCFAAFADQARGLTEGGADLLWIETMSDLDEVTAAIEGARSTSNLPIAVTLSYDTAGRTMMGVTAELAARRLAELGIAAIGANCGSNIADTEAAVLDLVAHSSIPVISKANAGIPEWHGDELSYSGTPEVMAAHAHRMREAGVAVIGGCCGSDQTHIALMRQVLDGVIAVPDVELPTAASSDSSPTRTDRGPRGRRGRGTS